MLRGWCGSGSARLRLEAQERHVLQHDVLRHMLREQVGRVFRPRDLCESEISSAEPVLHPQVRHMQVSDLSQATASAYADRRRSVR